MEKFAIPGVGGIIERELYGNYNILIQERCKDDSSIEDGMIEIPAGKIREFENIFDCLRREVHEETGLEVVEIEGEKDSFLIDLNGYRVLSYTPFSCAQNTGGTYPIMVQVFICKVRGTLLLESEESKNMRWVSIKDLEELVNNHIEKIYPMHIGTLRKYLSYRRLLKANSPNVRACE